MTDQNFWADIDEAYDFIDYELTSEQQYMLTYSTDEERLEWLNNLVKEHKPDAKAFLQALNELEESESF